MHVEGWPTVFVLPTSIILSGGFVVRTSAIQAYECCFPPKQCSFENCRTNYGPRFIPTLAVKLYALQYISALTGVVSFSLFYFYCFILFYNRILETALCDICTARLK